MAGRRKFTAKSNECHWRRKSIIIASQRGGAAKLAAHLLNDRDNEYVELYEVSGFMADTLPEALQEARAQSMGTRCNQYLFSVSLNPPETEKVETDVFEQAIGRIEERMKLQDQPRVIVFHEKEGIPITDRDSNNIAFTFGRGNHGTESKWGGAT